MKLIIGTIILTILIFSVKASEERGEIHFSDSK